MSFVCEFCGTTFNREYNLITHKKTARYCLEKRGMTIKKNECQGCGKCFSRKMNLDKHEKVCPSQNTIVKELLKAKDLEIDSLKQHSKEREREVSKLLRELDIKIKQKESEMEALEEEKNAKIDTLEQEVVRLNLIIAESKGKISVYKERPGVINNTQYINPKLLSIKCDTIPPLTVENVKQEVDAGKYTYDNFIRGETGLVDFISTLIADDDQRSYVCTDTARNKFHRLIETREWENDNGATFLNKILDQLKDPAKEYYGKILRMTEVPENRDLGEFLSAKTKPMVLGITCPKSKDRIALFSRIRTEVRNLASV